jgi:hypothetical protein
MRGFQAGDLRHKIGAGFVRPVYEIRGARAWIGSEILHALFD